MSSMDDYSLHAHVRLVALAERLSTVIGGRECRLAGAVGARTSVAAASGIIKTEAHRNIEARNP
jgi:hypothetical protein